MSEQILFPVREPSYYPSSTDEDEVEGDDDSVNDIPQEAESVRTSEVPLLVADGCFTTKDCILKFDLKYHPEFAGTYRVTLSVVLMHSTSADDLENEIGYLEGEIIKRPHPMFHVVAESISTEMQELAYLFCDARGIANRLKHPKLRYDDAIVNAGGFFHIDTIEVRNDQRTNDLSLRMIYETFKFLGDDWNLAVMKPAPLNYRWQRWKSTQDPHCKPTTVHDDNNDAHNAHDRFRLQQHFSRMGFIQSGRNPDLYDAFFVTKTYQVPLEHWINKRESKKMDLYLPPQRHVPTALDKELQQLIQGAPSNQTVLTSMMNLMAEEEHGGDEESASESMADLITQAAQNNDPEAINHMRNVFRRASGLNTTIRDIKLLIDKGACMDGARALNIAVVNCERCGTGILNSLIHFGANANAQDEYGNTALHYASQMMVQPGIETLLQSGADPNIKNLSGEKPLDLFEKKVRALADTMKTNGVTIGRMELMKQQQIRKLLQ